MKRKNINESVFSDRLHDFCSKGWSQPMEQKIAKILYADKDKISEKGEDGKDYIARFLEKNKQTIQTNCSPAFLEELTRLSTEYMTEAIDHNDPILMNLRASKDKKIKSDAESVEKKKISKERSKAKAKEIYKKYKELRGASIEDIEAFIDETDSELEWSESALQEKWREVDSVGAETSEAEDEQQELGGALDNLESKVNRLKTKLVDLNKFLQYKQGYFLESKMINEAELEYNPAVHNRLKRNASVDYLPKQLYSKEYRLKFPDGEAWLADYKAKARQKLQQYEAQFGEIRESKKIKEMYEPKKIKLTQDIINYNASTEDILNDKMFLAKKGDTLTFDSVNQVYKKGDTVINPVWIQPAMYVDSVDKIEEAFNPGPHDKIIPKRKDPLEDTSVLGSLKWTVKPRSTKDIKYVGTTSQQADVIIGLWSKDLYNLNDIGIKYWKDKFNKEMPQYFILELNSKYILVNTEGFNYARYTADVTDIINKHEKEAFGDEDESPNPSEIYEDAQQMSPAPLQDDNNDFNDKSTKLNTDTNYLGESEDLDESINVNGVELNNDTNLITLFSELSKDKIKYKDALEYLKSFGSASAATDNLNRYTLASMILKAQSLNETRDEDRSEDNNMIMDAEELDEATTDEYRVTGKTPRTIMDAEEIDGEESLDESLQEALSSHGGTTCSKCDHDQVFDGVCLECGDGKNKVRDIPKKGLSDFIAQTQDNIYKAKNKGVNEAIESSYDKKIQDVSYIRELLKNGTLSELQEVLIGLKIWYKEQNSKGWGAAVPHDYINHVREKIEKLESSLNEAIESYPKEGKALTDKSEPLKDAVLERNEELETTQMFMNYKNWEEAVKAKYPKAKFDDQIYSTVAFDGDKEVAEFKNDTGEIWYSDFDTIEDVNVNANTELLEEGYDFENESEPFTEGKKAFEFDHDISSNPYEEGTNEFDEWKEGFNSMYSLEHDELSFMESESFYEHCSNCKAEVKKSINEAYLCKECGMYDDGSKGLNESISYNDLLTIKYNKEQLKNMSFKIKYLGKTGVVQTLSYNSPDNSIYGNFIPSGGGNSTVINLGQKNFVTFLNENTTADMAVPEKPIGNDEDEKPSPYGTHDMTKSKLTEDEEEKLFESYVRSTTAIKKSQSIEDYLYSRPSWFKTQIFEGFNSAMKSLKKKLIEGYNGIGGFDPNISINYADDPSGLFEDAIDEVGNEDEIHDHLRIDEEMVVRGNGSMVDIPRDLLLKVKAYCETPEDELDLDVIDLDNFATDEDIAEHFGISTDLAHAITVLLHGTAANPKRYFDDDEDDLYEGLKKNKQKLIEATREELLRRYVWNDDLGKNIRLADALKLSAKHPAKIEALKRLAKAVDNPAVSTETKIAAKQIISKVMQKPIVKNKTIDPNLNSTAIWQKIFSLNDILKKAERDSPEWKKAFAKRSELYKQI